MIFSKNPYINLNMGLVKENFVIVRRKEIALWKDRGFRRKWNYPVFHHIGKEIVMLGKPLTIQEFSPEKLLHSKVIDYSPFLGTYGMGGPGFFGLKLEGTFGVRWLVYSIWLADEHLLFNGKILRCHPIFEQKYNPWILSENPDTKKQFSQLLIGLDIEQIRLEEHALQIKFSGGHTLETFLQSEKFPEQGGTRRKRLSYQTGIMADYWLLIYDGTNLMV